MSNYAQSYIEYLVSLRSSSLYFVLYKPSDLVGSVVTALNLPLYLLSIVGSYKIYTGFIPWHFFLNRH